jgi:hypothetical protein
MKPEGNVLLTVREWEGEREGRRDPLFIYFLVHLGV